MGKAAISYLNGQIQKENIMSYDLYLNNPITNDPIVLEQPHFMRGGTYPLEGELKAHINITYNYSSIFKKVLGENGIRSLYGLSGAESISKIKHAILDLQDDTDDDYWKPTEGNAKMALYHCLALAQMHPEGIWDGD